MNPYRYAVSLNPIIEPETQFAALDFDCYFHLGGGKYGGNFQPRETPLAHLPKSLLTKQKLPRSSITSQKPLLWNPFQPNRNDRI